MDDEHIACGTDECVPTSEQLNSAVASSKEGIVQVQIISDVICPWCYVGKRRFEQALKQVDFADSIQVEWKPFELNPDMPKDGAERRDYRIKKFGSWEYSQQLDAEIRETGQTLGLEFNYDKQSRTPSTFNAHRLIWFVQKENQQSGTKYDISEALFKAYFSDGLDVGNIETLTNIAANLGFESARIRQFLQSAEGIEEVRREELHGRKLGVNAVPAFVVNGSVLAVGAQDPGRLAHALNSQFRLIG
jgi:predicted DsbA family dithiol-disulfide isomerase